MGILGWIVFGLVVGALAKLVMPGRDPGGVLITIDIGIVGSLIGGFIGRSLMHYGRVNDTGDLSRPGFLMSLALGVVGSLILLACYRLIRGRRLTA